MTEQPFATDSRVLNRLYKRFNYLQDLPCELRGQLIDEATYFGVLEADDFLGFLMAYRQETQKPESDHFAVLSREENLKITQYRQVRPVLPWAQPTIGVALSESGVGRVTGTHSVAVVMKNIGEVQFWWGGDIAVIWEAFLSKYVQERPGFETLMDQLWQQCEEYLFEQGVQRIFTHNHDPEFEHEWYQCFLERRGYQIWDEKRLVRCLEKNVLIC